MQTIVEDVREGNGAAIAQAAEIIRAGELVAFPTETVYGLGAIGLDGDACAKIYEAKGRPSDNPLIQHVSDRDMVKRVARDIPPMAEKLMAAFMPGPLTLILPRSEAVPDKVTGGLDTVAVRMPENPVARSLIRVADVPIAAPSANRSGRPSPTTAAAVLRDLEGRIPMILNGGPCRYGVESTIVDCTEDVATILRPGAISMEEIRELLGDCRLDAGLVEASAAPKAPGMKYRHYAPKAPLTLFVGEPAAVEQAIEEEAKKIESAGKTVGLLGSRELLLKLSGAVPSACAQNYGHRGDLLTNASRLYACLLAFDGLPVDTILAEGVEEKDLGLAILNRLKKASGGHVVQV